jgi:hypothetical protein
MTNHSSAKFFRNFANKSYPQSIKKFIQFAYFSAILDIKRIAKKFACGSNLRQRSLHNLMAKKRKTAKKKAKKTKKRR